MKAKKLNVIHFSNELLKDFGGQRNLTDEQQIVDAFGKFMYGADFVRALKRRDDIMTPIRPEGFDVTYTIVHWAEVKQRA